ncbi:hypothetical protein LUZ60_016369 [Juncus effusus]|nr:hypothetical protein LUZ60_016369 [Juncus effusus]
MEQIVSQFLSKALHAILSARIPHIHPPSGRQPYRKRDRWFHLALGDLPPALDDPSGLLPQGVTEPLIIDVLLSPRDDPTLPEAIIERWVAQCEIPPPWSALHSPAETSSNSFLVKRTYKKSIILLRSIYSVLRLLPAHRIFKLLRASNQSYNYDLSYRISSFAEPFSREEESDLRTHCFAPVETQSGQLAVSVQYRPCLSSFNLEISSLLPPMLIADYVGSPAADPMRAFPSSPSPSNSSLLHHSTSAPHRFLHEPRPSSSAPASAPLFPRQNSFDNPANRLLPPQHRKSAFSFDEYKLSPPFYLSPTPSPPTFSSSSYMQSRLRSETAPVSIPKSGISNPGFRSPVSSDPARNFLPPPSPRRSLTLLDPSSQDSFRKAEGLKISDVLSNVYGGSGSGSATPKGLKDGRDDSGRFSTDSPRFGGASRSSSRVSDLEDADFSYPFAVDDVDSASDSQINRINEELGQNATSSSLKSQEAAVGALVHMLKNASPLRDSTFPSNYSSKSELFNNFNQDNNLMSGNSNSSSFLSRRASDALDELTSYKEIKEMLIRQGKSK